MRSPKSKTARQLRKRAERRPREVDQLQAFVLQLAERVYVQSELLSRRAEKKR